jgi:hypothetical protein
VVNLVVSPTKVLEKKRVTQTESITVADRIVMVTSAIILMARAGKGADTRVRKYRRRYDER